MLSVGAPCVAQRVWPMPVVPGSGVRVQRGGQVAQLALGAAAVDVAVHQRGDAGAVIAAIFQPPQRLQQQRRRGTRADDADDAAHQPFPPSSRCRPQSPLRGRASAPAARARAPARRPRTSSVITLPAATMAPSPTVTGATSATSEPMKTSRADRRAMLVGAVVVAGDRAGADIGAAPTDRRRRDRSGGWPSRRSPSCAAFTSTKLPTCTSVAQHGAGAQPGERADDAAGSDDAAFQMAEGADLARPLPPSRRGRTPRSARSSRPGPARVSAHRNTDDGIDHRHAGLHRRRAQPGLHARPRPRPVRRAN